MKIAMGKYDSKPVYVEILSCEHIDVKAGTVGKIVGLKPPRGIAVEVTCMFKSAASCAKPEERTEVVYVEKGCYRITSAPKPLETDPP